MKLSRSDIELLQSIQNKAVGFSVPGSDVHGGFIELDINNLAIYLENPDSWRDKKGAEIMGVGLDGFRKWRDFRNNPQCRGNNRKGQQCKNRVRDIPHPRFFNEDIDCYCNWHSRLGY